MCVNTFPFSILVLYVLSVSMNNIVSWILSLLIILSNFLFHIFFLDLLFSSVSLQGQYACTKTMLVYHALIFFLNSNKELKWQHLLQEDMSRNLVMSA